MAGPTAAGALIAATRSATSVYVATFLLIAVAAIAILLFGAEHGAVRPPPLAARALAGLDHVWRTKTILGAITLDLFAVLLGGAAHCCRCSPRTCCTSGRRARLADRRARDRRADHGRRAGLDAPFRRSGLVFVWSVAGFGPAMVVFGLSTWLSLSLAALVVAGALDNVSVVIRGTSSARDADDARTGVGGQCVFISSSNELGAFESGLLAALDR